MTVQTLLDQISEAGASASSREWALLPICSSCGLIQDENGPSADEGNWVEHQSYRKRHGVDPAHCLLTHTYCPNCFTAMMERRRAAQVIKAMQI